MILVNDDSKYIDRFEIKSSQKKVNKKVDRSFLDGAYVFNKRYYP